MAYTRAEQFYLSLANKKPSRQERARLAAKEWSDQLCWPDDITKEDCEYYFAKGYAAALARTTED